MTTLIGVSDICQKYGLRCPFAAKTGFMHLAA